MEAISTANMSADVKELLAKPCVISGCVGTMIYSLRAMQLRGNANPNAAWVCDTDPSHVQWQTQPDETR